MKLKNFLIIPIVMIGILMPSTLIGQTFCSTSANTNSSTANRTSDYLHVSTELSNVTSDFCLKVYVHAIRGRNGDYLSTTTLNTQIALLNGFFDGTGISFMWDGIINYIDNTDITNDFVAGPTAQWDFFDQNGYSNSDGIDFYFFNENIGSSQANGLASETQIAISLQHLNEIVLAHEMGHVLGLFHTYHSTTSFGTENDDDFPYHISECVDQSNGNISGDYVIDTTADTRGDFTSTLECGTLINDSTDACGDLYLPYPSQNYMNGFINCANTFTEGQIRRMKYFIGGSEARPQLKAALDACPTNLCNTCSYSDSSALTVFENITLGGFFGICNRLKFTAPSTPCNNDYYEITINGNPLDLLGTDEPYNENVYTNITSGEHQIIITPFRNGEMCTSYEYLLCVDINTCEIIDNCSEDCTGCIGLAETIVLQTSQVNGCTQASISVPVIDSSCFTGTIDWGDNSPIENITSNSTMIHSYTETGNYNVTVSIIQDGVQCDTATTNIDAICSMGCVEPCKMNPTIDIISNPGNCGVYQFTSNLNINPCDNGGLFSYNWLIKRNGVPYGDYPNTPSITTNFTSGGIYNILLTVSYRENLQLKCKAFASDDVFVGCSSRNSEQIKIKVFPNPTKQNQELVFDGIDNKDVISIDMFDLFGNSKLKIKPKTNSFKIGRLASGIYIVRFNTVNGIVQKKLIID